MPNQGNFTLFTIDQFSNWLEKQQVIRSIVRIQNHHTWKPDYSNFKKNNHLELQKGMDTFHKSRGFLCIAQHFTSFPDGTIMSGRPMEINPAGIYGANSGAICIEHVGNFDKGGDEMRDEHLKTILKMNALLCLKFNLEPDTDTLIYHHWYDPNTGKRTNGNDRSKSCPGTNFFGGNTVKAAGKHFIPKIKKVYDNYKLASQPLSLPTKQASVTARVLNVRSGPGTNHLILSQLKKNATILIFEEKDGWARISPEEQVWVSIKYIA